MMADITAVNNNVDMVTTTKTSTATKPAAASSASLPVPSFSLQITKQDADRFGDACEALRDSLRTMSERQEQAPPSADNTGLSTTTPSFVSSGEGTSTEKAVFTGSPQATTRLCEQLYEAARNHCQHPLIRTFLERMISASGMAMKEVKAGALIFHDMDKTAKLKELFDALSSSEPHSQHLSVRPVALDRQGVLSLFRSILFSIACCIQKTGADRCRSNSSTSPLETTQSFSNQVIVEGRSPAESSSLAEQERPTKRVKRETDAGTLTVCLSPSFDSSMATLRDEEEVSDNQTSEINGTLGSLRNEIEEICSYATDQVIRFVQRVAAVTGITDITEGDRERVTFDSFGQWYNEEGKYLVPWLELLQNSKWKTSSKSKPMKNSNSKENLSIKTDFDAPAPDQSNKIQMESPASLTPEEPAQTEDASRTLVSFDFSGSDHPTPLLINITEENLCALRHLVQGTGLIHRPATDICKLLLKMANRRTGPGGETLITLTRNAFQNGIEEIMTSGGVGHQRWNHLAVHEQEALKDSLMDFFSCFENNRNVLQRDEVDVKEFAVGFCFFCAGNKSSKLATGFELLDDKRLDHLSQAQLLRYLGSYLTVLVAMSLLKPAEKRQRRLRKFSSLPPDRLKAMRSAVENGAIWTLGHFLKFLGPEDDALVKDAFSFEVFANWYSTGGYTVAPWLELLDLKKVISLIAPETPESNNSGGGSPLCFPPDDTIFDDTEVPSTANKRQNQLAPVASAPRDRVSTLRRHHSSLSRQRGQPPPEILFTFPLANRRSLIVLKEDATYVRGVVEQLGLLSMTPDDLWSALTSSVKKRMKSKAASGATKEKGGTVYVDMATFVHCMGEVCRRKSLNSRKRPGGPGSTATSDRSVIGERLSNFFQCFDIEQVDSVALDELMGGLTLLCGGKKSTKLAFAFGVFDTRPGIGQNTKRKKDRQPVVHSLSGEDLFLFLRSILIVTFSCCRQSLDMTDENVGRCIADTANMICNDVMRHQWDIRQNNRLNFDEFGQWYNDGGFERAPWLELLDLKKWVLVDDFETLEKRVPAQPEPPIIGSSSPEQQQSPPDPNCPPPPPEDALDPAFFDENGVMAMDSMDEMDMILMQPCNDKEADSNILPSASFGAYSPTEHPGEPRQPSSLPSGQGAINPLKFHLATYGQHGGYMLSISPQRIHHLRRIMEETGLHELNAETSCNVILGRATRPGAGDNDSFPTLTKDAFDLAMKKLIPSLSPKGGKNSIHLQTRHVMVDLLDGIFCSFDHHGTGRPSAIEIASGFSALCRGKKSDKLEFAFEVLDKSKRGRLTQEEIAKYFQSFLIVLFSISFSSALDNDPDVDTLSTRQGHLCDRSLSTAVRASEEGADWAASMAFSTFQNQKGSNQEPAPTMSFDHFAEWYTTVGYSSIPWLELLDIQKWVMS